MPTIPYVKQTWTDGVSALSAARMAVIENGVYEASLAPAVRVTHSVSQAITTGTPTALAFDTERFDTSAGAADTQHDNVTNNSRLTCRYAGKYQISGSVEWEAIVTGEYRICKVRLNATTDLVHQMQAPTGTTGFSRMNVSTLYDLAVNDYVQLFVEHNRGANLNILKAANYSPEFSMVRVA